MSDIHSSVRSDGKLQSFPRPDGLENYRLLRQWLSGGPENYRTAGGEQLFDHDLAEGAATSADHQLRPAAPSRRVQTM